MKAEGWKFPPVREAEAMFEADTAPNWEEGMFCEIMGSFEIINLSGSYGMYKY